MAICDKIKEYRKKQNLTQTELAKRVGVTPQAISKWEKGIGYPDISLISPLANALQISTDVLFEHQNNLRDLNKKWLLLCAKCHNKSVPWEDLVELDNEILNYFPHDKTSLYRRVRDEMFVACSTQNFEEKSKWLLRAESHCAELIDEYPDFDSAKTTMVEILMASAKQDRAVFWANKCNSPDDAMKKVLKGEELRHHRQKIIDKKLRDLLIEMRWCDLGTLQASESIIKAVFPDNNYQYYYDYLMMIEYTRARCFALHKDNKSAILHLYKALEIAKEKVSKGYSRFTVSVFDELSPVQEDYTLIEQLYHMLEHQHPDFATIFETKEYKKLLFEVKQLI